MRQFIAAQHLNHWTAWEALHPEMGFGGDVPETALRRLFEVLELEVDRLETGDVQEPDRLAFVVHDVRCHACNGSGEYIGLNVVEVCGECRGVGYCETSPTASPSGTIRP